MTGDNAALTEMGKTFANRKSLPLFEFSAMVLVALVSLWVSRTFVSGDPLISQIVVWIANILMMTVVWYGLRLRGQGWHHLGLKRSRVWRMIGQSVIVFVVSIAAFMVGAVAMVSIVGRPEQADMSRYAFLQGNEVMLVVSLVAVFIGSSLGEEVIYRGFLLTRIAELGRNKKVWQSVGVLVSSVVFGLAHFEWGIAGMVQTCCMGLALAASYLYFGRNLWVTVLAHAYLDTILMVQVYLGI